MSLSTAAARGIAGAIGLVSLAQHPIRARLSASPKRRPLKGSPYVEISRPRSPPCTSRVEVEAGMQRWPNSGGLPPRAAILRRLPFSEHDSQGSDYDSQAISPRDDSRHGGLARRRLHDRIDGRLGIRGGAWTRDRGPATKDQFS